MLFDVLVRHLRSRGHSVRYVQNITDVDDSILKRAAELNVPYDELGRRYTDVYLKDMAALNVGQADVYPAATETIPEMRSMIARLLESGYAYRLDNGDVYFRISKAPHFGELGRLSRAAMCDIERSQDGSTIDDARKEDALDFLLWRGAREGEPRWPSPWGEGRPGWHIECSAMAREHLGDQIDIHGGGDDLIYPHHECEIAQSEAVTGIRPFARFWAHTAMVRLNGEKMSKSLGNLVFVRDLLREFDPCALRLYLLGCHYRTPLEFDEADLKKARALADQLDRAVRASPNPSAPSAEASSVGHSERCRQRFRAALDDDLDTPSAISVLSDLADAVLSRSASDGSSGRRTIIELGSTLGLALPR
jgi:L-cysteine:1D-myo-inositol 2-amino-2-deoxy-alpha-D-glucopyranoside ligase